MFPVISLLVVEKEGDTENDIGYLVFLVITINGLFMTVFVKRDIY